MSRIHSNKSLKSILGITLMTALLGLTACSSPANPDVKARQDMMKSYGDAMGVMGDMVKAPDTFDAAVVKEQAAFLAEDSKTLGAILKTKKPLVMLPKPFGLILMTSVLSQRTFNKRLLS